MIWARSLFDPLMMTIGLDAVMRSKLALSLQGQGIWDGLLLA
jgi:hypothetical protein